MFKYYKQTQIKIKYHFSIEKITFISLKTKYLGTCNTDFKKDIVGRNKSPY